MTPSAFDAQIKKMKEKETLCKLSHRTKRCASDQAIAQTQYATMKTEKKMQYKILEKIAPEIQIVRYYLLYK